MKNDTLKVVITNDHAAIPLKQELLAYLKSRPGTEVTDQGATEKDGIDYTDYAAKTCKSITSGDFNMGIFLCGTGAGMCITANKIRGIRAVVCSDPYTAKLSREHNDANVLCIGARVVGAELAKMIADIFLDSKPFGGRHGERVDKIKLIEAGEL